MSRIAAAVDVEGTARVLGLGDASGLRALDFRLPLAWLGRAPLNRLVHPLGRHLGDERVYYRPAAAERLPRGPLPILVRVDDYPRADLPTRRFFDFARILEDQGIQFLLGVTPLLPRGRNRTLTAEESVWLRDAVERGAVRLATHGTTHENLRPLDGPHGMTELVGVDPLRLDVSLVEGLRAFDRAGLPRPDHYIPPFNSFDLDALRVLACRYQFVHGGPLSLDTFARLSPGVVVAGAIYLPSYRPWYERARNLLPRVRRHDPWAPGKRPPWRRSFGHQTNRESEAAAGPLVPRFPLVLTLHWAWEQEDGMRSLRRLAAELSGKTARWTLLDEVLLGRRASQGTTPGTPAESRSARPVEASR